MCKYILYFYGDKISFIKNNSNKTFDIANLPSVSLCKPTNKNRANWKSKTTFSKLSFSYKTSSKKKKKPTNWRNDLFSGNSINFATPNQQFSQYRISGRLLLTNWGSECLRLISTIRFAESTKFAINTAHNNYNQFRLSLTHGGVLAIKTTITRKKLQQRWLFNEINAGA